MKLVIAIVSNRDLANVLGNTSREGYFSTRVATSGQFLSSGQTTILFGVENDKTEKLFDILKSSVTKRIITQTGVKSTLEGSLLKEPVDVEEYGAVAFVIDVEDFRKL